MLNETEMRRFERESRIHSQLNHPLIVGVEAYLPKTRDQNAAIVTEFIPNGTLSDHLPLTKNLNGNAVSDATRIAIIIVGTLISI
jgi:serine/threonine protein kinase